MIKMNRLKKLEETLNDYLINNRYNDEEELRKDIEPYFNEKKLTLEKLDDSTNADEEMYDYELLGEVKEENGDVLGYLNLYYVKTRAKQILIVELYLGEH